MIRELENSMIFLVVVILVLAGLPTGMVGAVELGNTYYVDSVGGNDENAGTSESSPWQSLDKVNATSFQPGDRLLFKAGSIWTGILWPKGSGSEGQPIIIDKYGEGSKPLFIGNGLTGEAGNGLATVYLRNQQYWEINNLEVTNDDDEPGDRRGVAVWGMGLPDGTVLKHIYLKNLDVHDVKGIIGEEHAAKDTGGIQVQIIRKSPTLMRFDDVLIEGCQVYNCENEGIVSGGMLEVTPYKPKEDWERAAFTNVVIRNNLIYNISKNAMIIRNAKAPLVEYNTCHTTATAMTGNTIYTVNVTDGLFQYNEGYNNKSPDYDGSLYDPDLMTQGTIFQYSYSHDNAHGLVWFCTVRSDKSNVVRYNISQNDKGRLVNIGYEFKSAYIYNNVFYIGKNVSPYIIYEDDNNSHTYYFYNNIIYNKS